MLRHHISPRARKLFALPIVATCTTVFTPAVTSWLFTSAHRLACAAAAAATAAAAWREEALLNALGVLSGVHVT